MLNDGENLKRNSSQFNDYKRFPYYTYTHLNFNLDVYKKQQQKKHIRRHVMLQQSTYTTVKSFFFINAFLQQ